MVLHLISVDQLNYLELQYLERWIDRRGFIEWPAKTPDLPPMDFFRLIYIKQNVYATQPDTIDLLRQKMLE